MLPDFNELPSVLNHEEVSVQFRLIMDIAESQSTYSINDISETLFDGISSLGYEPKARFDKHICARIFDWIKKNWDLGEEEFIDGAVSLLINVECIGACGFLKEKMETDSRAYAVELAEEGINEIKPPR